MQSPVTFQMGEPPVSHNPSNGLTGCLLCIPPGKFPIVKRKLEKKKNIYNKNAVLKDLPHL